MPYTIPAEEVGGIDVHGHYGHYDHDSMPELQAQFFSADVETVLSRARHAHTEYTVVSPMAGLTPVGQFDVLAANAEATETVASLDGLLQYAIVNPLQPESYEQAADILTTPKCVGIKIHPESHVYPIAQHGEAIFRFAAEQRTVISTHSGCPNSPPEEFIRFADEFPETSVILAHLGNSGIEGNSRELQVRALQQAKNANVYIDTSSIWSILPGIIEWAVCEVGADRLLFGTDTPVYYAPCQWARIVCTDLTDEQKRLILRENAFELFGLG